MPASRAPRRSRSRIGVLMRGARMRAVLAAVMSFAVLSPVFVAAPTAAAADLVPVVIDLAKVVDSSTPSPRAAGNNVNYTFTITCSSTQTDCVNLELTDSFPEPLVFVSVNPSSKYTIDTTTANGFTLTFTSPLDEGGVGLTAGETITFQAIAQVPANVDASFDGDTITNTAFATVDNPDSNAQASADVVITAPFAPASTITKTVSPTSMTGFPDTPVTFALGATNSSNAGVDRLVIQDPATLPSNAFDYVAVTGMSGLVKPTTSSLVLVEWFDGSAWRVVDNDDNAATPGVPSANPTLTAARVGAPLASIKGLRFTFTEPSNGQIPRGASAGVTVGTATTAAVSGLTSDFTATNIASSQVTRATTTSTLVTAQATYTIRPAAIAPVATKTFSREDVVGGEQLGVTLGASNGGDFSLSALAITEPSTGTTALADQGLVFLSWSQDDVVWPVGATSLDMTYVYASDPTTPVTTTGFTTVDALPQPTAGEEVVSFTAVFRGTMTPGAYATLPYTADTIPVPSADTRTTNSITVDATTVSGQTATAIATDDLTRRSARIDTTISKSFSPGTITANPGASILLSLPSQVAPRPTGTSTTGSTVGVTSFVVSDVDPDFWDSFDATSVVATAVPSGSTLTVQYTTDGGATWIDLAGAVSVLGPTTITRSIPTGVSSVADGIRFVYAPSTAGALLPPGFNVQPNVRVTLREDLRGTGTPVMDPAATANLLLTNDATATVENAVATPTTVTATDDAVVTLRPAPAGGGPGEDMIAKAWADDVVSARSAAEAALSITWSTAGLEYDSVVISDAADDSTTATGDPSLATIASSVYEAFDLVRIPRITAAMDPHLAYDRVARVELFNATSGAWVATATNPCAGTACNGTFPGYTLTAAERASTIGARLVFEENPSRPAPSASNPSAPLPGTGVAASYGLDRQIDFVFQIRDVRRSNGAAVLGSTRLAQYNAYDAAQPAGSVGLVDNSASIDGLDAAGAIMYRDIANDTITILDSPINVLATKTWIDGPLGIPTSGTPAELYPSAFMSVTARNASDVPVNELRLDEPTGGTSPFDVVDLVAISPTSGTSSAAMVTLWRNGVADSPITLSAAQALTASSLADVTGIALSLTGRVAPDTTIGLNLSTRLREFVRGTTTPVAPVIVANEVTASVVDPGGITTPVSPATDNVETDTATASLAIEAYSYAVTATKTIVADTTSAPGSPAIQYDGNARTARVALTGQPSGTARTTEMVIEDTSPTFWNAYNLTGLASQDSTFVTPVNRVRIDLLMGATASHGGVEYDTTSGIASGCTADPALDANCWVNGTSSATWALPTLPSGFVLADVRGIRFTFTKADGSTWERPFNPIVRAGFTVERRTLLVSPAATPVPSTLFTYATPAPGESVPGVFTNEVDVTSSAKAPSGGATLWSAADDAQAEIRFQHLPARVTVQKSPFGAQSLSTDIPYRIVVTNSGSTAAGAHDKALGDVVVTDTIPVVAGAPLLVFPLDPDTGVAYDPTDPVDYAQVITVRVANAANVTQATPAISFARGPIDAAGQTFTFTVDQAGWVLPVGWTMTFSIRMQFQDQLDAGTQVLNTATVTADQPFDSCDYFTDATIRETQRINVQDCSSTTRVWPLPSAPVSIVKAVRGVDAGPLDEDGDPLLDTDGTPFDDLGIIKTIPGSKVNCTAPNVSSGLTTPAEYYRYPCVPITRPGGTEEWVSTFTNGGNIGLTDIVAIDVLPAANDRGVIVNEARSSKWTPVLSSYPELLGAPAGTTFTVYYQTDRAMISTRCNGADIQASLGMTATSSPAMTAGYQPCLANTANPDDLSERNSTATGWKVLPPTADAAMLASVVGFKLVLSTTTAAPITPGSKISIIYRSTTSNTIPLAESTTSAENIRRDSIAYNSIAAAAAGLNAGSRVPNQFVTEPRKVGVAMATGEIQLSKVVDGPQAGASANSFVFDVACTSNGQPVTLYTSTGAVRPAVTVPKNGSTLMQGIPLYSDCAVTEGTTYNQTIQATTPASGVVRAEQPETSPSTVFDPNPAFGPERPDIEIATITNTFSNARLTITKAINSPAVTTDGGTTTPAYSNFQVTVSCTFNNGVATSTVLSSTTVTITPTTPYVSPVMPAGSLCTVTEGTRRDATSVTYTFTNSDGASTPVVTNGSSTPAWGVSGIRLTADGAGGTGTNTLAVTNNFQAYSVTVNKALAGAWASANRALLGDFTVTISCTAPIASGTRVTVYTGSFTFTPNTDPAVMSHTFSGITRNANCTLTETTPGGAVATWSGGTNVINNITSNQTRTVTNTFDSANLDVTKTVNSTAVDGAGDPVYLDAPYVVGVSCTFPTSATPVYAAGYSSATPMTLTFTAAELAADRTHTESLTGLPSGATCAVTETSATPNATSTNVTYVARTTGSPAGKTASFVLQRSTGTGTPTPITNTATVNNFYGVEHFVIEKSLQGAGSDQFGTGPFTIDVNCVAGSVETYDGTVTLPLADGSMSYDIGQLAAGSECTAVETNAATTGADRVVYKDGTGSVITSSTAVDAGSADPRIVVENWYLSGAVTVTKAVTGAGASQYGAGPFEVTLSCERDGTDVTLNDPVRELGSGATPAAMSTTFTGLPTGAECVLTETDRGGATSSSMTAGSTTVGNVSTGYAFTVATDETILADNQAQTPVTITNDFELADVAVTKRVVSDSSTSYGPFPMTVDCTFQGGAVYGTGYSSTVPMERSLEKDETWTVGGLPAGAECDVVETDDLDAVSTSHVTTSSGVAQTSAAGTTTDLALGATGVTNSVVFTNVYDTGSLSVAKVVDGPGRTAWGTATFTIDVDCTLTDASGTRTVYTGSFDFTRDDTAAETVTDIPAGSSCAIEETVDGTATATTITIDGDDTPGTSATALITSAATEVVVTNTFALTSVEVTKVRSGDTGAVTGDDGQDLWGVGPFEVELSCTFDGAAITIPDGATRSLDGTNGYLAEFAGLPVGADCDIDETRTGGANVVTISDPTFTTATTPQAVTVENEFHLGDLAVTKTFSGAGSGQYGVGDFEVTLSCERVVDGVTETLVLPDDGVALLESASGYEYTYRDLPVGAECSLAETKAGFATAVTIGAPQTITRASVATAEIELDNEFQLASLAFSKVVTGPFVNRAASSFVVTVECWKDDNGTALPVALPVSSPMTLAAGETVAIDDLPVDSECSFAEPGNGGANMGVYSLNGVPMIGSDLTLVEGDSDLQLANVYLLSHAGVDATGIALLAMVTAGLGVVLVGASKRRARS